jgi:hypothetical protein
MNLSFVLPWFRDLSVLLSVVLLCRDIYLSDIMVL